MLTTTHISGREGVCCPTRTSCTTNLTVAACAQYNRIPHVHKNFWKRVICSYSGKYKGGALAERASLSQTGAYQDHVISDSYILHLVDEVVDLFPVFKTGVMTGCIPVPSARDSSPGYNPEAQLGCTTSRRKVEAPRTGGGNLR